MANRVIARGSPMLTELCRPQGELRRRAREEIRKGRLPQSPPASMWGGSGSGLPCAVCGDSIRPDQVEYETTDPRCGDSLRLHMQCHTVWQIEGDVGIHAGSTLAAGGEPVNFNESTGVSNSIVNSRLIKAGGSDLPRQIAARPADSSEI